MDIHLVVNLYLMINTVLGSKQEYCIKETFNPSCSKGEVINMQYAVYGRMRTGKCLKTDFYLGCSVNVLQNADNMCSGREECSVPLFNSEIANQAHCLHEDLSGYLEADYSCEKVYTPRNQKCNSPEKVSLSQQVCNIASETSQTSSCGLHGSPWILEAANGQQIDIAILDFNWKNLTANNNQCPINYGYILDMQSDDVISICGGYQRERNVYQSTGNTVQVIIERNILESNKFILQFQASGCPDFKSPAHSWIQKENDSLVIGCLSSDKTWKLQCVDNKWLGIVGNCTKPPELVTAKPHLDTEKQITTLSSNFVQVPQFSNNHVVLFTIACLTLLTCCVIIILGVYCTKRYDVKLKKYRNNKEVMYKDNRFSTMATYKPMSGVIQMDALNSLTNANGSIVAGGTMIPPAYTFPNKKDDFRGPQVPPRNSANIGSQSHQRNDSITFNNRDSSAYENIAGDEADPVQYYILENPTDCNSQNINF